MNLQQDIEREFKKLTKAQLWWVKYYLQHLEFMLVLWILRAILPPGAFTVLQFLMHNQGKIGLALKIIQDIERKRK